MAKLIALIKAIAGGGGGGGVSDVQIDGTSIVSSGVANVPMASDSTMGVMKVSAQDYGIGISSSGMSYINKASTLQRKQGNGSYRPICPADQHESVFYGLAKAAGDTTQKDSENAVGTYTDAAKAAILAMIGISGLVGNVEGATASQAYSIGDAFLHNGKLYKATASISSSEAIVPGTNCAQTTIIDLIGGN